jgi:NADPH2:quinone reductase
MRAIAIEGFGGRDRLKLVDLPAPEPGPDDVLVCVWAAGAGPWDAKTREGLFGGRSFPYVLRMEASGVVEGAGEDVEAEHSPPASPGEPNRQRGQGR